MNRRVAQLTLVVLTACSSSTTQPSKGKGRTESCGVSSECSAGLLCLEGSCTAGCRSRDECSGAPPNGCATWACVSGACLSACDVTDGGPKPDATPFPDAMTFPDATALDVGIRDAQTRDAITPDMDADMSQDAIARDVGDVGPFDAGPCDPTPRAPQPGDLVVNEILSDPAATIAGDANADGTRDSSDDEFVEIGNVSGSTLELSGVIVSDSAAQRHVFASRTLGCGDVVVVFGGGDPSGAAWNAHWVPASSGGLSLNNGGDRVRIGSSALNLEDLAFADYGSEADSDQSVVRERELDPTAALVQHRSVAPGRSFSPGVRSDGSAF